MHPVEQKSSSHFPNRLGVAYASSVSQQRKKRKGQFFMPVEIAALMASYSEFGGDPLHIFDPGCGAAVLSCALMEHIVNFNKHLSEVGLVAYKRDSKLIPISEKSLSYLEKWEAGKRICIKTKLQTEDFMLHDADIFNETGDLFSRPIELFYLVISNPPCFKPPIDDQRAIAAKIVVNGHPHISAIFMTLSAKLLRENGELIFLTPSSHAAGSYFKAFREYFFKLIEPDKVHLFVSRKDTSRGDKVLQ